jgi:CheY-like chemotaxis protein
MNTQKKANILLVDDNPNNLLALEAILENPGQKFVKATSDEEALKQVNSELKKKAINTINLKLTSVLFSTTKSADS